MRHYGQSGRINGVVANLTDAITAFFSDLQSALDSGQLFLQGLNDGQGLFPLIDVRSGIDGTLAAINDPFYFVLQVTAEAL